MEVTKLIKLLKIATNVAEEIKEHVFGVEAMKQEVDKKIKVLNNLNKLKKEKEYKHYELKNEVDQLKRQFMALKNEIEIRKAIHVNYSLFK